MRSLVRSKHLLIAATFTAGLIVLELFLFSGYYDGFHFGGYLHDGLFVKPFKIAVLGISSYVLAVFFVFAALVSPYRYRIVYFALFCLSVLVEYSYQRAFLNFTTSEDIANALYAADSRIVFNTVPYYFDSLGFIPCAAFGILLVLIKPLKQKGLKVFLFFLLSFVGFYSVTAYISTNTFPSLSFNAFYRTLIGFPINWRVGSLTQAALIDLYNKPRQKVGFRAVSGPGNNIVFIVDESMRGDHLSLNGYSRPTTPFLEELNRNGLMKNWAIR